MKVTGNQLRAAIKSKETQLKVAIALFEDSLEAFADETKDPMAMMDAVSTLEYEIVKLQEQQGLYNQMTIVNVNGQQYSLALVVKYVGGAGRIERLWRSGLPKKDRYRSGPLTREAGSETAKSTVSGETLANMVADASNFAASLRSAMATANTTEVDLPGLTQDML